MRRSQRIFQNRGLLWARLVLCALLLLALPHAVFSAPTGQSAPDPGQPAQTGSISQTLSTPPPGAVSLQRSAAPGTAPQGYSTAEEVKEALLKEPFSYSPNDMIDPFVSFITPMELAPTTPTVTEEEAELPPEPRRPLTPLQKMSLGEIERGLSAISWGELGRKALIEDSAGKGYIVGIGTPAGDKNGYVTEIFNDRLVIQQEVWDRKLKKMVPLNSVVKLRKEKEN